MQKASALIENSEALVTAALEKANVSQVVNGESKNIPLSQASLPEKISALLAVNPVGANQQQVADLLVTNANIASQIETLQNELSVAEATVGGLQAEKQALTTRAETSERAVDSLTKEKASREFELKAATSENGRQAGDIALFNAELSRVCVRAGCLALTKDGKSLPPDATEETKIEAANSIPWKDKLSAYNGAVHSAVSRIGIDPSGVPNSTAGVTIADQGIMNQLESIKNPTERAHFYKENEKAILTARRSMR